MGSIKEELLIKAQRDISKLVKVQRMVTRHGKTFPQDFYVLPSQVKSTDKVIGNKQNLLPKPGSVPKPAPGVLSQAYFDSIKSNKKDALDYLKSCGVTWDEHSHPGINWMRAMQALKGALGGQNAQNLSSQNNTQTAQSNSQFAQNKQVGIQNLTKQATQVGKMLDQATLDELNACKNGREKVIVLKKKLGQDGCMKFAESLGVTWDKHTHSGINNMRMTVALQNHFDSIDGTVSPSKANGTGKVGAPKNNKNAQKDIKNDDKIEIPSNATERQKNLINLINNISDKTELESYTSIGMIPEDDVSKSFIMDKLVPKYQIWASTHLHKNTSTSKKRNVNNSNNYWGFADQLSFDLNYEGCSKKVVGYGLETLYTDFNMAMLTDPRSEIDTLVGDDAYHRRKQESMYSLLTRFDNLSYYTTDEYMDSSMMTGDYLTNKGYTGFDPDTYAQRYDIEKEGFTRALRTIENKCPQLESKCDEMIDSYDRLMEICHRNPRLLHNILLQTTWNTEDNNADDLKYNLDSTYSLGKVKPSVAKKTVEVIDEQYNALMTVFREKKMTEDEILNTLNYWNDDFSHFTLYLKSGKEDIDLTQYRDKNGSLILNASNSKSSSTYVSYFRSKYITDNNISSKSSFSSKTYVSKKLIENYNYLKQVSEFSGEDFLKAQDEFHKLFGITFTKQDLNSGQTVTQDLLKVDPKNFDKELADYKPEAVFDKDKDYILSNLMMYSLELKINGRIVSTVGDNTTSKLNDKGTDYSGNYSFYDSNHMEGYTARQKQNGGSWSYAKKIYTKDELNHKINEQLDSLVTYTPEYIDNLYNYYNAKSNFQDATEEAKKATFHSVGINIEDYVGDPLKDILYNYTTAIAQNIPQMSNKGKDKLDKLMAKRLDYIPYDFKATSQRKLSDKKQNQKTVIQNNELKSLRENLLKSVHCSISVEPEDVSLQMRKDFLKNWDYQDGHSEMTPDGFIKSKRIYSGPGSWQGKDRRALFNSRFFKVNNSNMNEGYQSYKKELEDDSAVDSRATQELHLYHACSYASAAGILGHDGAWFMGNQYTKTAKALGNGAYFGYKGGKSSVYCGEGSGGYHNTYASGAVGDNANGCYILADVIRGKNGKDSESDHGHFRDYEIVVKNNKCIRPHHFVDISARSLDVNIKRDSQGNYTDINTGKILYDKYGKSVNMK